MSIMPESAAEARAAKAMEKAISDQVGWFFLKDASMNASYDIFCSQMQSQQSLLAGNLMISLLSLPILISYIMDISYRPLSNSESLNWGLCIAFLLGINTALWVGYVRTSKPTVRSQAQHALYFTEFNVLVGYLLIYRSRSPECTDDGYNWYCSSTDLPADGALIAFLVPLVYTLITTGANHKCTLLLVVISVVAMVVSAVYLHDWNAIAFIVLTVVTNLFVLLETRRQSYRLFFAHRQVEQNVKTKPQSVDEVNAIEMRHMIANVAHDLKTVSPTCPPFLRPFRFPASHLYLCPPPPLSTPCPQQSP